MPGIKTIILLMVATAISVEFSMAQENDTTFYNGITHTKPKFFFAFDNSRTFVRGQNTIVRGFKTGAEIEDRFRLGVGFYVLGADIVDEIRVERENLPDTNRLAQLKMSWLALNYDYIFFSKGKWEFSIPVNIGLGNSHYEYFEDNQSQKALEGDILMYWLGVNGQYKVIRYAGVGFGVGYSGLLLSNEAIEEKIDSPYYVLKLQVYLGEIYRAIFKKDDK